MAIITESVDSNPALAICSIRPIIGVGTELLCCTHGQVICTSSERHRILSRLAAQVHPCFEELIMAEVNDEATNALIASMLAEDNHYTEYDAYNIGPDSEDDDWGGSKKKQKKGLYLIKLLLGTTKYML